MRKWIPSNDSSTTGKRTTNIPVETNELSKVTEFKKKKKKSKHEVTSDLRIIKLISYWMHASIILYTLNGMLIVKCLSIIQLTVHLLAQSIWRSWQMLCLIIQHILRQTNFSVKIFKSIHLYLEKWLSSRFVNVYYSIKTNKICLLLETFSFEPTFYIFNRDSMSYGSWAA